TAGRHHRPGPGARRLHRGRAGAERQVGAGPVGAAARASVPPPSPGTPVGKASRHPVATPPRAAQPGGRRFLPVAIAAVLDLLSVGAFVAIGRASPAEAASLAGFLGTAWPFAVGLVAGWAAMRAWRHPMQVAWTGVGIWLCTVVLGLALRALLTPDGAPLSFAVV